MSLALQDGRQRARVRSGQSTEEALEHEHEVARRTGLVVLLSKIPTPTVGAHGALRYSKRSTVDYQGVLPGGRALLVEAKRCSEARFPLARIEQHQRDALDAADRAGAVALVLVVHGPVLLTAARCVLPWAVVRAALEAGAKSITAEELLRWRAPSPWLRAPWIGREVRS